MFSITGAATGIGAAISEAFAKAGYAVAVTDIDEEAATAKAGELKALGLRLDVVDCESISACRRNDGEGARASGGLDLKCRRLDHGADSPN